MTPLPRTQATTIPPPHPVPRSPPTPSPRLRSRPGRLRSRPGRLRSRVLAAVYGPLHPLPHALPLLSPRPPSTRRPLPVPTRIWGRTRSPSPLASGSSSSGRSKAPHHRPAPRSAQVWERTCIQFISVDLRLLHLDSIGTCSTGLSPSVPGSSSSTSSALPDHPSGCFALTSIT